MAALRKTPFHAAPLRSERLAESGPLALFAGETDADAAFNAAERETAPEMPLLRNSLFLRRQHEDGTDEWQLLLTTGGDWSAAEDGNAWCANWAKELGKSFFVSKARFASDGRHLWLVCDPHTYTYFLVCSFDIRSVALRVLGDGDSIEESPDGTLHVKNRKTYLQDEAGNSLGAAWYDEWIAPDGRVVRQSSPTQIPH